MKKTFKLLFIIIISLVIGTKDIKAQELPKVYFEGNIKKMVSKSDERKIKLKYVSEDLNFESYIKIKVQGTSSLAYDKKNYTIKLYQDKNYEEKLKVDMGQGWGKQYKFCLKANWIDKTHARNIVTAKITSDIQNKYNLFMDSPNNGLIDGFPTEIYINDEFLGIYTWNIPKDAWMFNMDEENPNHVVLASEGYFDSNLFKEDANFDEWEVEAGPETKETLDKFNKLINFIKNSTDEEFKENFEQHLNLNATLNYYVMLNYANLIDNTAKNMLMVTYDGEIWFPSLYDLDTSWGTDWNGASTTNYKNDISDTHKDNLLWTKFTKLFANEIANRYFELRKDILTKENVLNEFNKFYNSIPKETLKKEQEKWENIPGFDISQIEEFLTIRTPLVDEKMYNLYTIEPNIEIKYSTKKATIKPVTVNLIPNRNDIKILKDGKEIKNNTLSFIKNGTYKYEYQDWNGNKLGTIEIEINNIIIQSLIIPAITIALGLILFITLKKKKNNNKESKIDNKKLPKEEIKKTKKDSTKKNSKDIKKKDTNKVSTKKNNYTKQKKEDKKKKETKKNIKSKTKKDINPKN